MHLARNTTSSGFPRYYFPANAQNKRGVLFRFYLLVIIREEFGNTEHYKRGELPRSYQVGGSRRSNTFLSSISNSSG